MNAPKYQAIDSYLPFTLRGVAVPTLAELNHLPQAAFVSALGAVFEDTPEIAAAVWGDRPFTSVTHLHQGMVKVLQTWDRAAQLKLLQAHPDLGSKVRMAIASVQEQQGAGLDRLTPEEYAHFLTLNRTYRARFGFPFIVAVRNHTKESILQTFEQRSRNSVETEITQALVEVAQIAEFRLREWVEE